VAPDADFGPYDTGLYAAAGPMSLAPNMIGDTSFGGCGGLTVAGVLAAAIGHPTYACSRLNIAENNSPTVRDRVYFTYRHFHNATPIDIFSYAPLGGSASLDIDQFTLGIEMMVTPCLSVELRVPINTQFGSVQHFSQSAGVTNLNEVLGNRDTSLGNISLLCKRSFCETDNLYVSGGLGLNIPTAPDVRLTGNINDPAYEVYNPVNGAGPVVTGNMQLDFDGVYKNQTVNLMPFLAAIYRPTSCTFTQGFLQIDVPLNESDGRLALDASFDGTSFPPTPFDEQGQLAQQALLRLNWGAGIWLYQNRYASRLNGIAAMLELHYTTTLNDADIAGTTIATPLDVDGDGTDDNVDLRFGNAQNRSDVLNLAAGIPVVIGKTTIYNGFIVPLTERPCRGIVSSCRLLMLPPQSLALDASIHRLGYRAVRCVTLDEDVAAGLQPLGCECC
jgi:hypothetical protein